MTDRATATTLGYTLGLGIALVLSTGLIVAGGNFVEQQREETVRTELEVVGQQLAATLSRADHLHQTSAGTERLVIEHRLPARVSGSGYSVAVPPDEDYIELTATRSDVTVRVNVTTRTDLAASTFNGGDIAVEYDPADDEIEVRSA